MKLLQNLDNYQIILASQSPRRQELLKGLNIQFEVMLIDVDEVYPSQLVGVDIPMFLAEKKAKAYQSVMNENSMIITTDTIVWHEGQVLGQIGQFVALRRARGADQFDRVLDQRRVDVDRAAVLVQRL